MSRTIVRHTYPAVMAGLFLSAALVLGAHSDAAAASAVVNDVRVGEHPGVTRVVLDVSQRTNATFDVSSDGRTLFIVMPDAEWRAGNFAAKHAKGLLTDFQQSISADGLQISLLLDEPVRMKPPFFVAPEGTQGDRVVIDLVPDPTMASAAKTASKAAPAVAAPNVPLASAQPAALASSAAMLPPTDIAMEQRMVAGLSNVVPPQGKPVEVAQASYTLSPSQKTSQTAQAQPPQQAAPARQMQAAPADNSGFGGLLYVKAAAGLNVMEESNTDGGGNRAAIETDFGWIINGGLGLDLKNGLRLEGEVLYSQNQASQITGTANNAAVNSGQAQGDISLLGFMANVAYDFNTPYALTPFVFGGVGIANVSLNGVGAAGAQAYDSSDTVFAMQGGAGLSTDLTDRTSVDLSYRYIETLDAQMSDARGAPFDFRYASHMILMGLKYKM